MSLMTALSAFFGGPPPPPNVGSLGPLASRLLGLVKCNRDRIDDSMRMKKGFTRMWLITLGADCRHTMRKPAGI